MHPYNFDHMRDLELKEILLDYDKDQDGLISFIEFLGEGEGQLCWGVRGGQRGGLARIPVDVNKDQDGLISFTEFLGEGEGQLCPGGGGAAGEGMIQVHTVCILFHARNVNN